MQWLLFGNRTLEFGCFVVQLHVWDAKRIFFLKINPDPASRHSEIRIFPEKNWILKNLAPDPEAQIFLYTADLSANAWVYPKNFGPIGETVSEQFAFLFT